MQKKRRRNFALNRGPGGGRWEVLCHVLQNCFKCMQKLCLFFIFFNLKFNPSELLDK